jgi:hypothetical protein
MARKQHFFYKLFLFKWKLILKLNFNLFKFNLILKTLFLVIKYEIKENYKKFQRKLIKKIIYFRYFNVIKYFNLIWFFKKTPKYYC